MPRALMLGVIAVAGALLVGTGVVLALLVVEDDDGAPAGAAADGDKGYIGLTVASSPLQGGLRVAGVIAGGPADVAGIEAGDLIRSVDGQVVRTPEQLRQAVESKPPGTRVSVTYERAEREFQATVRLGEATAGAAIEATPKPQPGGRDAPNPTARAQLGVQAEDITPAHKERFNLTRDTGVVVVVVFPGTAAANAGIRPGDIITTVEGAGISSERELRAAVARARAGDDLTLGILRGSDQMTLEVRLVPLLNLPGLDNLPPALQERLRELAESGNLSPELLRRFAMGQNFAYGTVKEISETSLTVTRLDAALQPENDVTFMLDGATQYRSGSAALSRADIAAGATVAVVSLDGTKALVVLVLQR
jgi:membrane-associated protease RseP (regulator of RpoE activity)